MARSRPTIERESDGAGREEVAAALPHYQTACA